nr:hypothetical protein [Granulibacter bethesdensis]
MIAAVRQGLEALRIDHRPDAASLIGASTSAEQAFPVAICNPRSLRCSQPLLTVRIDFFQKLLIQRIHRPVCAGSRLCSALRKLHLVAIGAVRGKTWPAEHNKQARQATGEKDGAHDGPAFLFLRQGSSMATAMAGAKLPSPPSPGRLPKR